MSAYIESKAHIDALVRLSIEGPAQWHGGPGNAWTFYYYHNNESRNARQEDAERIGAMLTAENVRSVQYRYPDDGMDTIPGPIGNSYATDALLGRFDYNRRTARHLTALEGLMAIAGYEYQACEHPEWESSEAATFCDRLRRRLIDCLPGYRDVDTWSIHDETAVAS